ncbi:MAG: 4-hydroxy-tetrahydrodipicolinate synthase [Formivibrio sp.]|nr:4-hydroxy-tetrahydrodipicolinate synthase [Formivibrio sp.]
MLTGSLVAIATPMFENGDLDFARLKKLVDWHIEQGTDGIVAVGTTGESPTVGVDEHLEIIRVVIEQTAGRVPVIAGTGANSTREAIHLTERAKSIGADYALSVVPYYNKPTQEGLYQHFKTISEAVDIPVILYNVPGRTSCDLANDTVLRLAELRNIVGIKDATGNIDRAVDLISRAPANFTLLSGDDATTLAFILLGGHGTISVTANVAPRLMHEMCNLARQGNIREARIINDRLQHLHRNLFIEANPIPVKWALAELGHIDKGIRLPLTWLTETHHQAVKKALTQAGLC